MLFCHAYSAISLGAATLFFVHIYSTQDVSGTQQMVNKCFFLFFF